MSSYIVNVEERKEITRLLSEITVKKYEVPAYALCPHCNMFMMYYPDARTYAHEDQDACDFSMTVESYIKKSLADHESE